ncbi:glycosyltransferase family 2 protein [Opitutus sp. ER46]|uniref:glycosyltransferase family 2 protein n=1 Tax=Opitutus sp. ER46 TaxID=2161864 RepID=UPI000D309CAE|nr:glycosyltransferase family 2 protein [Opitutus sp. ER46]PTX95610.1 hypothetical protein DB354_09340 [Opitutus sp. ER46]
MSPEISVVIPVYNEAGNLRPLLRRLAAVLSRLGRPAEVLVVNDGSTDGTAVEIAAVAGEVAGLRELRLPSQSGQAHALWVGLQAAAGGYIVTLDGDGQDDPEDIPLLLAAVAKGEADLACGWRVDRQDTRLRRAMSALANAVRRGVLRDGLHDAGCQLRVFRRAVGGVMRPGTLMQTFLPALAVAAGFRVREYPVRHHARRHGASHYGLAQLWWRPAVALVAVAWRLRRERRARFARSGTGRGRRGATP